MKQGLRSHLKLLVIGLVGLLAYPVTSATANTVALRRGVDLALRAPKQPYSAYALSDARQAEVDQLGHGFVDALVQRDVHFKANGEVEQRLTIARYFVGREGIETGSELHLDFDSHRTRLRLEHAHVLQKSGTVETVEPGQLVLRTADGDRIFDNRTRLIVPFATLTPGSVALLGVRMVHQRPNRGLPWSRTYYPQGLTPTERFELNVSWATPRVKPQWSGQVGGLQVREGEHEVRFAMGPILPVTATANPRLLDHLPQLTVAARVTWPELASRYRRLVAGARVGGPSILSALAKLELDGASPAERFDRIHRFVVQDVRYLSNDRGETGALPDSSVVTLQRGYGDCKDKTILFLDLARAAGLQAYPALVATGRHVAERMDVPALSYFDHMVACVDGLQDRSPCVDLTANTTAPGRYPGAIFRSVRLELHPDRPRLKQPPIPQHLWLVSHQAQRTIDVEGRISEQGRLALGGLLAEQARAALGGLSNAESDKWLLATFQSILGANLEPKMGVIDKDELDKPLILTWKLTYPAVLPLRGPNQQHYFAESVIQHYARAAQPGDASYSWPLPGMLIASEVSYHTPEGVTLLPPAVNTAYRSPIASMQRQLEMPDNHTLRLRTRLETIGRDVASADVAALNSLLSFYAAESYHWFHTSPAE